MMIKYLIALILIVSCVSAYELTGDNLIEPRYLDGNLLIFNEGYIPYSVFSNGTYAGTINNNQGMYVNETLDYQIYASYNEIRDITDVETVKKKFNQWWLIIVIFVVLLIAVVKVWKVITR